MGGQKSHERASAAAFSAEMRSLRWPVDSPPIRGRLTIAAWPHAKFSYVDNVPELMLIGGLQNRMGSSCCARWTSNSFKLAPRVHSRRGGCTAGAADTANMPWPETESGGTCECLPT